MTTNKPNYDCWFLINPDQEKKEFQTLEKEASRIFLDFISGKNYGKGSGVFRFDIYVKPTINYGRHADTFYDNYAHLVVHIDKPIFDKSTEIEKVKLLLTASLILMRYLAEKVPLPKEFMAMDLVSDYGNYLTKQSLLVDKTKTESIFYKHFETTHFNFRRAETIEVDKNKIHFDLNEIEDFINNKIAGKTFGKSITTIDFGFELYDFNGAFANFLKQSEGYKRYGTKHKNYLVAKHFDYSAIKNLDSKQQFELLKLKILEGINDFDTLTRKPKDFDKNKLYEILDAILTEYETIRLL